MRLPLVHLSLPGLRSIWLGVVLIAPALLALNCAGVYALIWRDTRIEILLVTALASGFVGLLLFVAGMWLFLSGLRDRKRREAMRRAGRDFGLSNCRTAALLPVTYRHHPLIRFAGRRKEACVWGLEGEVASTPVTLFEHAFQGGWRDERGRRIKARFVQTVAALPAAGPLADFHLGPVSEWDELAPQWHLDLGLLCQRTLAGLGVPARARDEATLAGLFTPDRQTMLQGVGHYAIECSEGTLLVYRPDRQVEPEELSGFLADVGQIAQAFRDVADRPVPAPREQREAAFLAEGTEPESRPHRSRRPPPRAGRLRRALLLGICLAPVILCVLFCIITHIVWARSGPPPGISSAHRLLGIPPHVPPMCLAWSVAYFGFEYRYRLWAAWHGWLLRRAARKYGLRPRWFPASQLREMPLVRLLRPDPVWVSSRCASGLIDGHPVAVVHLAFRVIFWPGSVRHTEFRTGQTVALIPGLSPAARFSLGPPNPDRDALFPHWASEQDLPLRSDPRGAELHANLDASVAGLTPALADTLARFPGWSVEGAGGLLMIYRLGVRATPGDLREFLETVRRISTVLAEARGERVDPLSNDRGPIH